MEKIKAFFGAFASFFTEVFTKETLVSIFTPREDYGRFFYWGFLVYVLANIFVSDFVSLIFVAVVAFIAQVVMYAYSGRKLTLVDFVFAMLPAAIISLQIWI